MKGFQDLFERQSYALGLTKSKIEKKLEITRPTLLRKLKDPKKFRAYEVFILKSMGFNISCFKNINNFKY